MNKTERKLPDWLRNKVSEKNTLLTFKGSIEYCSSVGECGAACEEILNENAHLKEIILGFDMEWPVTYTAKQSSQSRTAVIQICANENKCYIFHVNVMKSLPLALIQLLEDSKTILVGVNIVSDLWKLNRDFSVSVKSLIESKVIDLGKYANEVLKCSQVWSMANLVTYLLGKKIEKHNNVRISKWNEHPLPEKQLLYAATDAYASFLIYITLKSKHYIA